MLRISFYISYLFFFFACSNGLETVEKTEDDGAVIRYTRLKTNFAKQGAFTKKDANGIKIEDAQYLNDTLHGERRLYYFETGELQITETYNKGAFSGPYKIYYKNGQIKFEGNYNNGILEGKTKGFYDDGQLKEIVAFDKNEENGPFEEYHPNGKIKAKGTYLNGDNEHGLLEIFDEKGTLIKKMQCEKGVCRTTWKKEDNNNSKKI